MSKTRPPTDGADALAANQPIREAHVTIDERDFDTIGIDEFLTLFREAGLREFEAIACHGDGAVVQVEVEHPLPADRLESLGSVNRWEQVGTSSDWTRYVVEFTAPEFPASLAVRREDLIGTCDPELTDHGVAMSLVGRNRRSPRFSTNTRKPACRPNSADWGPTRDTSRPSTRSPTGSGTS